MNLLLLFELFQKISSRRDIGQNNLAPDDPGGTSHLEAVTLRMTPMFFFASGQQKNLKHAHAPGNVLLALFCHVWRAIGEHAQNHVVLPQSRTLFTFTHKRPPGDM